MAENIEATPSVSADIENPSAVETIEVKDSNVCTSNEEENQLTEETVVIGDVPVEKERFSRKVWRSVTWFGGKVFDGMEWVGEGVVSVLGLDDSRFQDVLDGMTEEEMAVAVAVHQQRQEEYRQMGFTVAMVGEETEEDLLRENDEAFQNLSYGMIAGSGVDRVRSTQIVDVEDVEVAVVTSEPPASAAYDAAPSTGSAAAPAVEAAAPQESSSLVDTSNNSITIDDTTTAAAVEAAAPQESSSLVDTSNNSITIDDDAAAVAVASEGDKEMSEA